MTAYGLGMTAYEKLYINGQWMPSSGTDTLSVTDSATEEVIATIPEGTAADECQVEKRGQAELGSRVDHVVFDQHLKAEARVPEHADDEQDDRSRRQRGRKPFDHASITVVAEQRQAAAAKAAAQAKK